MNDPRQDQEAAKIFASLQANSIDILIKNLAAKNIECQDAQAEIQRLKETLTSAAATQPTPQ